MFFGYRDRLVLALLGFPEDPVIQGYAEFLIQHSLIDDVYFIDLHQLGGNVMIDEKGFHSATGTLAHEQISAVYNRYFRHPEQNISRLREDQFHCLQHCLDCFYEVVVNRPLQGIHNFSKLWHQLDLQHEGLETVPSEILVNSTKQRESYIMKSISAHRSICKRYTGENAYEPILIQPEHGQHNIRVHCIGHEIVAQSICSDSLDYRYSKQNRWEVVQLPQKVMQACRDLTTRMGLIFSGIDLLFWQDKHYLLEINPSPGYIFFEEHMQEPMISKYLTAVLLSQGDRCA